MISALGFAMALQFKPDGKGGWLYRKDQTGAPLPATAAERDGYVRWYGWIVVSSLAVLMGTMMIGALIANWINPDPTNNQGAVGAIIFGGGAFLLTYLYLKWFSHAPARAFASRAPAGPAQTRKQVFGGRMAHGSSYTRLALTTGGLIVLGLIGLRDHPEAWWLPFVMILPIGLALAYRKWSIDREPG